MSRRTNSPVVFPGVYPLFRRSAPDLSGAALRVHVTLTPGPVPLNPPPAGAHLEDSDSQGAHSPAEEVEVVEPKSSVSAGLPVSQQTDASMDDTFSVSVTVDRAMRLSLKGKIRQNVYCVCSVYSLHCPGSVCVCVCVCVWQAVLWLREVERSPAAVCRTSLLILHSQSPQS